MSEGMSIGFLSIWLVCTVALTIGINRFLAQARRKNPEEYARMVERTKRNSKWVLKTYLVNPSKDFWEHHK